MSPSWTPEADMPSLQGKVAIVTGGSAGIGFQTVKSLYHAGAKVYMASRSEDKATKAIEKIVGEGQSERSGHLEFLRLDLTDVPSIIGAAKRVNRDETRLDILINNAGAAASKFEVTDAGWDKGMMANYVGHFIFTNHVITLMKKTAATGADVRVITLSSEGMNAFLPPSYPFTFDQPDRLTNPAPTLPWAWRFFIRHLFRVDMVHYSVCKTADAMFALELQARLDGRKGDDDDDDADDHGRDYSSSSSPIISISVHPGGVYTDMANDAWIPFLEPVIRRIFFTSEQGAVTSLFAATAVEVREQIGLYKGKYLAPMVKIVKPHPVVENEQMRRALWDGTEKDVGEYLEKNGLGTLGPW